MKKIILSTLIVLVFSLPVLAKSPKNVGSKTEATSEKAKRVSVHGDAFQGDLRDQMVQLLVSMSDLDIMINRDGDLDYALLKDDADRMLTAIAKIRTLDQAQVFKPYLDQLESLTTTFRTLAEKRNRKANDYPEQMFKVCFQCHAAHRDENLNLK